MTDAELDELRERARRCQPIPVPDEPRKIVNPELRELLDRYPPIPVPWPDGKQCLATALAQCLRLPVGQVPPRQEHEDIDAWDAKVAERLGVRLECMGRDEPGPPEPWIAIIPSGFGDGSTHAVAVLGNAAVVRYRLAGFRVRPA